jgi:hypothetical protein
LFCATSGLRQPRTTQDKVEVELELGITILQNNFRNNVSKEKHQRCRDDKNTFPPSISDLTVVQL